MNRLFLLLILCTIGCASPKYLISSPIDYTPSATVTPKETIKIADSYRIHKWKPTDQNVYHGRDPNGVLVNTPDISLNIKAVSRPGWWIVGKINEGIPYKWGGFDTPLSFDHKLEKGYYAGDAYSKNKRLKLYSAISHLACGVDCSGFVSRCWRLPRAYSTRQLPSISDKLNSFDDLKTGDIVNKYNSHVLLFEKFIDKEKKYFLAYETGSPPSWRVLRHRISVDYLKNLGYSPYRYKNIIRSE